MKKLFLFLTLFIAGITANAQFTPYNNLNYMKLLKTPPNGLPKDSVLVYDSSDQFVKMRPTSTLVPEHNSLSGLQGGTADQRNHLDNAQVSLVNGSEQTTNKSDDFTVSNTTNYPSKKALVDGLNTKVDKIGSVISVAGKTGVVTLTKSDVGLGNVDNTSDLNKPISTATQTAINSTNSQFSLINTRVTNLEDLLLTTQNFTYSGSNIFTVPNVIHNIVMVTVDNVPLNKTVGGPIQYRLNSPSEFEILDEMIVGEDIVVSITYNYFSNGIPEDFDYATKNEINFPLWVNKSYSAGQRVYYVGKYYIANENIGVDEIPESSDKWIEFNSYVSKSTGLNKYNKSTVSTGVAIDANGNLVTNSLYSTSDFIEIKPSTNYNSNTTMRFICLYDHNKVAIPSEFLGSGTSSFTTSYTSRYIRISIVLSSVEILDLRSGISPGITSPETYSNAIPYSDLEVDQVYVNPKVNLFNNTENLSSGYFTITNSIKGTDVLKYKGISLTKMSGSNFYSNVRTDFAGNNIKQFETGKKYFLSCYVVNLGASERFVWMRYFANGTLNGHGPKLIDGSVRRIWVLAKATSQTSISVLSNPINDYGATSSTAMYWLFSASNFLSPDTQAMDIRIGGFQIESIDDETYVDGVALIGDSTMAGSSGKVDNLTSREVSTFASGLLNVPFFNRAVGGERTDTMDARWSSDITPLAKNCKYAIIQGGINDLNQDRSLTDIQSSITSMYNKAVTDGMIPILMTCTPSALISVVPSRESNRLALNSWMKRTYPLVLDIATVIADPEDPSSIRSIWAGDGTHYSVRAKRAIANAIARWEYWDFKTPKPYQQVLSNWTPTKQVFGERKIGDIKNVQGISIFAEDNNINITGRGTLD